MIYIYASSYLNNVYTRIFFIFIIEKICEKNIFFMIRNIRMAIFFLLPLGFLSYLSISHIYVSNTIVYVYILTIFYIFSLYRYEMFTSYARIFLCMIRFVPYIIYSSSIHLHLLNLLAYVLKPILHFSPV